MIISFLDLNKVDLFGWESPQSIQSVDAIVRGIENNDVFPPVFVLRLEEDVFRLFTPDGGHTRAIGHYIANQPLRVVIKEPHNYFCYGGYCIRIRSLMRSFKEPIHIGDIPLVDNIDDYLDRKQACPKYR